jgi:hypothetical protein
VFYTQQAVLCLHNELWWSKRGMRIKKNQKRLNGLYVSPARKKALYKIAQEGTSALGQLRQKNIPESKNVSP